MTIAHFNTDEVQALRDRVAELEAELAAHERRGVNPYPMPYYSRMTAEPVTLFAEQNHGTYAAILLAGVVVHVDLGNNRGGFNRAYVYGWIAEKEMDKLEDRTE